MYVCMYMCARAGVCMYMTFQTYWFGDTRTPNLLQRNRVLLDKLIVTQLVKKSAASYGTRRLMFMFMFTRNRHWTLSWDMNPIHIPDHILKVLLSIILLSTFSFWSVFFQLQFRMHFSFVPWVWCSTPHLYHQPWLDRHNYSWLRVQIIRLLIMQLSLVSCYFLPLRLTYSPQHCVLNLSVCSSLKR
jgi:hypothetical protein